MADFSYDLAIGLSNQVTVLSATPNALGVVPFIKFVNNDTLDTDAKPKGEIEPLIQLQDQYNRLTFILNLIAEKTSFKTKWMLGIDIPEDGTPWKNLPGEIWAMQTDNTSAKVGQFDADNPSGIIEFRNTIKQELMTKAQIPPHYGQGGDMVNISADALTAAEATLEQKIRAAQLCLGEQWERVLRLAAYIAGDEESASDLASQIVWRDASPRSLSQVADAISKLSAAKVSIPTEWFWRMLPGVTNQDISDWQARAEQDANQAALTALTSVAPNS